MTKSTERTKHLEQVYADAETDRKKLEEKYKGKVKVAVLTLNSEDEPCVVFFRTATTFTKMQCMDLAYQSYSKASATLFDATVIREASDTRVFQQNDDNDAYYLGALEFCLNTIIVARDTLKKK
jgi:hypothetical protein